MHIPRGTFLVCSRYVQVSYSYLSMNVPTYLLALHDVQHSFTTPYILEHFDVNKKLIVGCLDVYFLAGTKRLSVVSFSNYYLGILLPCV